MSIAESNPVDHMSGRYGDPLYPSQELLPEPPEEYRQGGVRTSLGEAQERVTRSLEYWRTSPGLSLARS